MVIPKIAAWAAAAVTLFATGIAGAAVGAHITDHDSPTQTVYRTPGSAQDYWCETYPVEVIGGTCR